MPRKKWIDKHSAQTFQLLHRPQTDPSIHDETLPDRILYQVSGPSSSDPSTDRALHIADLEDELDYENVRENEGEAASYGIYYDDSQYDYMQHLRDLGEGGGEAHFLDAAPITVKGKGKAKTMKLEDALREVDLNSDIRSSKSNPSFLGDEGSQVLSLVKDRTLEAQQDIPDEIAGFQPDMDPRLREALEALEDDAYVDEKDEEGMFGSLVQGGPEMEVDLEDFEAAFEDDDDGWESDRTERPPDRPPLHVSSGLTSVADTTDQSGLSTNDLDASTATAAASEDGAWLADFAKFKRASASTKPQPVQPTAPSTATGPGPSTLYTLNGAPLRKKRRKGALTDPSAYSMTSASLARTEAQQVLDARFDRIAEMYALDEEEEDDDDFSDQEDGGVSVISGASKMSKASQASMVSTKSFADEGAVRSDFEGMMDGFLEGWERGGGKVGGPGKGGGVGGGGKKKAKRGKNGNELIGLSMLDEIRRELGPARLGVGAQRA
ncbi:MAG: hypothetical protein Q9160_001288 [Pyrenula sp. 1 TL-2023]